VALDALQLLQLSQQRGVHRGTQTSGSIYTSTTSTHNRGIAVRTALKVDGVECVPQPGAAVKPGEQEQVSSVHVLEPSVMSMNALAFAA
jgi:hypothetical protein